jgi:hypothetical protein
MTDGRREQISPREQGQTPIAGPPESRPNQYQNFLILVLLYEK